MANCNCNDFPISCAPHAPGGDCCHPHGCPPRPCPPPKYKPGTSMYIGARYVPIFADPVEWDDEREYEPLTIVIHDGSCYTSKCYVPKGAQLPPYPEGQTKYWVKTSDYNYQFADLKKTVLDLSRLVEQFQKDNKAFTDLINSWNEKVERLDTIESNITDLTASLNAEIDRAKAAEQANAAAISKETTDRQQAISELDAAYKAADAAEAQARESGDAANAAAIAQETTDRQQAISELDAAYKAADAAEAQARADADTALNNRIGANKTDIDALKAEQAIQNTNISKNAKNISGNAAEIAKHAARLSSLESNASDWDNVFPDTTIAQEVQKEELARANADTALNGRCDTIAADVEEVRDIANHKVDATTYTAGQAAQDTKINAAQAAANKANTNIGDWETDHPGQTIAQEVTRLNGAIPDVSGFVTETTYNQGQAAQNDKITAAQTAANKANTSIGDWDAQHPGKTIAQEVTRLNGAIPDVSGFVTETTYNQGQAAQNDKITAAQTAATKANTSIGNWDAQHPGKTIAQEVTRLNGIDYLAFLNKLYPEGSPIPGGIIDSETLYPCYYNVDSSIPSFDIPVAVPAIVPRFEPCWTLVSTFPTSVSLLNSTGKIVETKSVKKCEILGLLDNPRLNIGFSTPFTIKTSGLYYFKFGPVTRFKYSWTKNNVKFVEFD